MTDTKPTVPEVAPLVWALYGSDHGSCGGHLHIVLDDGNLEDHNVDFCIEDAEKDGCVDCATLARLMRRMTRTQRGKLSSLAYSKPEDQQRFIAAWTAVDRRSSDP